MLALAWITLLILGVLAAVTLWSWVPYVAGGIVVAVGLAWVLISTLSPAVPDRTCPHCGREGLVKIRRGEPGVRCELCSFRDEEMHVAYLDEW